MISITKFKALCEEIKTQVSGITDLKRVSHEGHAVNKLTSANGVQVLALYPSADRSGSSGAGIDANATWFFVLSKNDPAQSPDQEDEQFEMLQTITTDIRKWIEDQSETGHKSLTRYDPSKTHIDPEYNEFGGWNGWSMSIVF